MSTPRILRRRTQSFVIFFATCTFVGCQCEQSRAQFPKHLHGASLVACECCDLKMKGMPSAPTQRFQAHEGKQNLRISTCEQICTIGAEMSVLISSCWRVSQHAKECRSCGHLSLRLSRAKRCSWHASQTTWPRCSLVCYVSARQRVSEAPTQRPRPLQTRSNRQNA